jgi:hypothetical protein
MFRSALDLADELQALRIGEGGILDYCRSDLTEAGHVLNVMKIADPAEAHLPRARQRGIVVVIDGRRGMGYLNVPTAEMEVRFLPTHHYRWQRPNPALDRFLYLRMDMKPFAGPAATGWSSTPAAGVPSGDQGNNEYSYHDGYYLDPTVGAAGPSSGMTALTQAYDNMNLNTASGEGFASTAASAAGPSSSGFDGSADQARYFPASSAATGATSGPGYIIVPERTEYSPEHQQDPYD